MKIATLAVLILIGGWLRFTALDFGLPDKFRPDEEYLVSRAVGFHESANPNFAIYPAAQMYVQHGTLRLLAWAQGVPGDFRAAFAPDGFAAAHEIGRQVSAAFGTATIPAIYWAAAPLYGPAAALSSAAVMSLATLHVRDSKYATTDAAAVFWLTLAIGMMLRVVSRGSRLDSFRAGLFAGLAVATKYPAGAVLVGIACAHLGARFREGRAWWGLFADVRPYIAALTALTFFALATPYFFLDWEQTMSAFAYQRGFVERGIGNTFAGWGWGWLFQRALPDSFGPILASAFVLATVWTIARPRPGSWSLLAFLAVALLGITSSRYTFYRYLLIPLPALVLFVGFVAHDAKKILTGWVTPRWATAAVTLGIIVLLVPSAIRDYKLNRLLGRRDTRTMAREWIQKNIPAGSTIAATKATSPYGKPQVGGYRFEPLSNPDTLRRSGTQWVLSDSHPIQFFSPGPTVSQLEDLDRSATLVFDVDPIKPNTPPPIFDQNDAFYVPLRHASSVKRPGPRIRIWQLE